MKLLSLRPGNREAAPPPKAKWRWPSQEELRASWDKLVADASDVTWQAHRDELLDLMLRVLDKRDQAAEKTEAAHWFQRGAAGASAGVSTLTGGTLIGNVHGLTAHVIGIAAAGVGLAAAGIAAARPGASYVADLGLKAQYEQLWWDMRAYAITQLATARPGGFRVAMNTFAEREAKIMAGAAPTSPAQ